MRYVKCYRVGGRVYWYHRITGERLPDDEAERVARALAINAIVRPPPAPKPARSTRRPRGQGLTKKELKARRRAKGLCFDCPAPAAPGASRCEHHLELSRQRSARRYAERKKAGLCQKCNEPAVAGSTFCATHRQKMLAANRCRRGERRSEGQCISCGRKLRRDWHSSSQCAMCLQRAAEAASTRFARAQVELSIGLSRRHQWWLGSGDDELGPYAYAQEAAADRWFRRMEGAVIYAR